MSSASPGARLVVTVNSSSSIIEAIMYEFVPPIIKESPGLRPAVEIEVALPEASV